MGGTVKIFGTGKEGGGRQTTIHRSTNWIASPNTVGWVRSDRVGSVQKGEELQSLPDDPGTNPDCQPINQKKQKKKKSLRMRINNSHTFE